MVAPTVPNGTSLTTLPTRLPVWLTEDLAMPLDLEASYEEACRVLKIR